MDPLDDDAILSLTKAFHGDVHVDQCLKYILKRSIISDNTRNSMFQSIVVGEASERR